MPAALAERPFRDALDVARTATFTAAEWEAYDRAKMAEQDARGALAVARDEGRAVGLREGKEEGLREGKAEGLRAAVLDLCELLGLEPTDEQRAGLEAMGVDELEALRQQLKQTRRWPGAEP